MVRQTLSGKVIRLSLVDDFFFYHQLLTRIRIVFLIQYFIACVRKIIHVKYVHLHFCFCCFLITIRLKCEVRRKNSQIIFKHKKCAHWNRSIIHSRQIIILFKIPLRTRIFRWKSVRMTLQLRKQIRISQKKSNRHQWSALISSLYLIKLASLYDDLYSLQPCSGGSNDSGNFVRYLSKILCYWISSGCSDCRNCTNCHCCCLANITWVCDEIRNKQHLFFLKVLARLLHQQTVLGISF